MVGAIRNPQLSDLSRRVHCTVRRFALVAPPPDPRAAWDPVPQPEAT
jgi:hypothetical protein